MTPLGHSLFGATLAVAGGRSPSVGKGTAAIVLAAVVSANVPDLPLPGWGHSNYRVSHSVFVGLSLIATAGLLYLAVPNGRQKLGGWRVFRVCAAALLSHYLLDSFYNHGRGIALSWPISDARLALPIPWFSTLGSLTPALDWHLIRTCAIELVCYGSLLGIAVWVRRGFVPQHSPSSAAD